MGLFKKKKVRGGRVALVFDIGSGSVGAGLVHLHKREGKAGTSHELLYSHRESIRPGRARNIPALITVMKKTLRSVTEHMHKEGLTHLPEPGDSDDAIDHIYLIISGTWTISKSTTISYKKKESFEVTNTLIEKLVAKEMKQFTKSELFSSKEKIHVLERSITSIKLNGYQTAHPLGKEVGQISVDVYASVMPKSLHKELEKEVGSIFHTKSVSTHSFGLAATRVIQEFEKEHYALIDVSGALTEVLITENGTPRASASFPLGSQDIVRSVAEKMKAPVDEAESLLRTQREVLVHGEKQEKLRAALEEVKKEWLEALRESVASLPGFITLPSYLYITTDPDTAVVIKYFLQQSPVSKGILNPSTEAQEVTSDQFLKMVNTRGPNDTFLLLETSFVSLL